MKKIICDFLDMPARQLIDCRVTSIHDILKFYQVDIDPYILYLLGEGINFVFGQVKLSEQSGLLLWLAGGSVMEFEERVLENMKIPHRVEFFENDEKGFSNINNLVNQDIPVLMVVDSRYILDKEVKEHKIGALDVHSLTLTVYVGYDVEENNVYLDLKDSSSRELYCTNIEKLIKSRTSRCYPIEPANKCIVLEIDRFYIKWIKDNFKELLIKNIKQTCKRMLDGDIEECFRKDRRIVEVTEGISGINRLCEVMLEFSEIIEKGDIEEKLIDKVFLFKFQSLREELLPGSNTCYREEFGIGLQRAVKILDIKELDDIGRQFCETGYQWRNFVRLLYNAPNMIHKKSEYIFKVRELLKEIADREKSLFEQLYYILNCIS